MIEDAEHTAASLGEFMRDTLPLAAGSSSFLICAVGGQCSQSYGGC